MDLPRDLGGTFRARKVSDGNGALSTMW